MPHQMFSDRIVVREWEHAGVECLLAVNARLVALQGYVQSGNARAVSPVGGVTGLLVGSGPTWLEFSFGQSGDYWPAGEISRYLTTEQAQQAAVVRGLMARSATPVARTWTVAEAISEVERVARQVQGCEGREVVQRSRRSLVR